MRLAALFCRSSLHCWSINDQIRESHGTHIRFSADQELDINDQSTAFFREAGMTQRKGCTNVAKLICPPMFSLSIPRAQRLTLMGHSLTSNEALATLTHEPLLLNQRAPGRPVP